MDLLPLGMKETPPATPWGINFGGGLNSTALIIECRRRGLRPDWILFADTGSERPGTLEHVERMRQWCEGWAEVTTVRWERSKPIILPEEDYEESMGEILDDITMTDCQSGVTKNFVSLRKTFESLGDNCKRTKYLPSKAYGLAGCTMKWKVQPMEKWRKQHGYDKGSFAVGYDAEESTRIENACKRGDAPDMVAWYPLVAWGIGRDDCQRICDEEGIKCIKSSCYMCPNMRAPEWRDLRDNHPDLFEDALLIERLAMEAGNADCGGLIRGSLAEWNKLDAAQIDLFDMLENDKVLEDRCHHGGCFT